VVLAQQGRVYESALDVRTSAVLDGHRVRGDAILPGSAYVAMALAAAREQFGGGSCELHGIELLRPMSFRDEDGRVVQLALNPGEPGAATVAIHSRCPGSETWLLHAVGKVISGGPGPDHPGAGRCGETLEQVRARCTVESPTSAFYDRACATGMQYGAGFRAVERLWRCDGEALARINANGNGNGEETPPGPDRDAMLLDACLQGFQAAAPVSNPPGRETDLYLLYGVERVRIASPLPARAWSHVVLRPESQDGERVGDVELWDDQGRALGRIEGVWARRAVHTAPASQPTGEWRDWLHEVVWRERTGRPRIGERERGRWLILSDSPLGQALAGRLRSRGHEAIVAALRGDLAADPAEASNRFRILADAPRPFLGVIDLGPAEDVGAEVKDAGSPEAALATVRGVFERAKSLLRQRLAEFPRLWTVTRGAQFVPTPGRRPVSHPMQAPVWGCVRVLAHEVPELRCALVDLDPVIDGSSGDEASYLCEEVLGSDSEDQIAIRGGRMFVARLARVGTPPLLSSKIAIDPDATYLITGGLGGLGRVIAAWMVDGGARRLVLVGRGAGRPGAREALRDLQERGARIELIAADVSRAQDVAEVLSRIRATKSPLRGVIHSAGVVRDGHFAAQEWRAFAEPFAAKALGAWHIDEQTRDDPLDFFVMCSSAAAVLGPPGQAGHAAACAYLDALAQARRAQGRATMSLGWGAWAGVGEAARSGAEAKLSALGMAPITPDRGLAVLEEALRRRSAYLAILPVDWRRWRDGLLRGKTPPLLAELANEETASEVVATACSNGTATPSLARELAAAAPEDRAEFLRQYLRMQVGCALHRPVDLADDETSFQSLGLDSIMHIDLKNHIERDLEMEVPLVVLFRECSIAALASELLQRRDAALDDPPERPADPCDDSSPALLNRIDELSEQEVEDWLVRLETGGVHEP
jgi:NAD(P)-dependent dehydrogenase (short-subunit alcohol dehydrogenase family)